MLGCRVRFRDPRPCFSRAPTAQPCPPAFAGQRGGLEDGVRPAGGSHAAGRARGGSRGTSFPPTRLLSPLELRNAAEAASPPAARAALAAVPLRLSREPGARTTAARGGGEAPVRTTRAKTRRRTELLGGSRSVWGFPQRRRAPRGSRCAQVRLVPGQRRSSPMPGAASRLPGKVETRSGTALGAR